MKQAIIAFLGCMLAIACSKGPSATPIPPDENPIPADTSKPGGGSDTGSNGGGTRGGNNNGVTLMRGTGGAVLFYSHSTDGRLSRYFSEDGFATLIRLNPDSSGLMQIKLVNAEKATVTVDKRINEFGYTQYEMNFSNASYFSHTDQTVNPDTAGKLQIWIYREDGKNIMPETRSRPAINKIIQIPGWFPGDPEGYGLIRLLDYDHAGYPVHKPEVTLSVLQEIFTKTRWSYNRFVWPY